MRHKVSRPGCGNCCSLSAFAWLLAIGLLIEAWDGSPWPLRAIELAMVAALVVAIAYQQRGRGPDAASTQPTAVYQPPRDGFAAAAQDIAERSSKAQG